MFRVPYKWRYAPLKNINHMWWDLRNGVRNVWLFASAVWFFRRWDSSGLLEIMQVAFRDMQRCHEKGRHVGAARYARQLATCADLCRRLREETYEDQYFNNGNWRIPEDERRMACKRMIWAGRATERELGRLIGKHLQCWWD